MSIWHIDEFGTLHVEKENSQRILDSLSSICYSLTLLRTQKTRKDFFVSFHMFLALF